ncbi:MAG: cytochrome P450 [Myxococcota bacterium]
MVSYDPYAYRTHEDPYPIYAALRARAPVYRNEEIGFWALSRHADVLAALRDFALYSNRFGVSLDPAASHPRADATMSFLAMDPPRHTRMRALVSSAFTPRRVSSLEPHIRELASRYLDRFVSLGRCEFIRDFAGRLPMDVVSEMIGVPAADREELRGWADAVVHREEHTRDVPPEGMQAAGRLLAYFRELVIEREKKPRNDLTGALLAAEIDGDRLSPREVLGFLFLMIIAGNETTTKLLANALYWLWRNPGERDRVREDPGRIACWVEETLRYDGSTQALARTLSRDVELQGEKLREGDRVVLLIGSANRDERVFEDPDRFDILRNTSSMLSFGQGTHFCLGAALARLEARVALEEVWRRMPDFEIDPAGLARIHSINVRGFAALPVGFRA